ncbi:hypothetical protein [Tomitella fengzijianii]|uniref:3-keto-disaccharide hydrolase domain-containing protein n=1 Tax=Tomitella fengzijianii TaxID=2597660 RepID=A0A516X6V1_9ACTN|nr:hypothetical protein [Tomitella fengzijianii]QDQ98786.1 hypothetical protein FO059_17385 [Tomitella fengzijianii]
MSMRAGLAACGAALVLVACASTAVHALRGPEPDAFHPEFAQQSALVTNEFAHRHPAGDGAVLSPDWIVTSGSLFARDSAGWTGVPDGADPDAQSGNGTGSAVFRAVSRRADLGDTRVDFDLRVLGFVTTPRTPAQDWDGVHVFLRYQSDAELYAVSVIRRDGTLAIKKKTPGGPINGGAYTTLAEGQSPSLAGTAVHVTATVRTMSDGSVVLSAALDGATVLRATDTGQGGPPIHKAGRVGLRGDNCEFAFRGFRAQH